MRLLNIIGTLICLTLLSIGSPGAAELASISGVDRGDTESEVFTLNSSQTIAINSITLRRDKFGDQSSAWILNSETRELVWKLRKAKKVDRTRTTTEYEDEVELPAGTYELYLTVSEDRWNGNHNAWTVLNMVIHNRDDDDWDEYIDVLEITVTGDDGQSEGRNTIRRVKDIVAEDAIVSIIGIGDDESHIGAFRLDRDMEVNIIALGELKRKGSYDSAWLIDLESGKTVWKLSYRNSKRAGGAKKNRIYNDTIELKEGRYAAQYLTDDSHAWPDFNQAPPYDPMIWGITVRPVDPGDLAYAKSIEYEDPLDQNTFVELTKMRDNMHRSQGFSLSSTMDIRIFAVGEGKKREMYDYGWIVDANTLETIWEMNYRNTDHAGGDEKNRLHDEVHKFEAGDYVVHFATDDSHSYRDWNLSAPFYKNKWGITLMAAEGKGDLNKVSDYDHEDNENILARIVDADDHEFRSRNFTISRSQSIGIYAIGEGTRREMSDYAWIEDSNGDIVWEMRYRKTKHAGGAKKNRQVHTRLELDAGEYEVFYVTDGSHSYRRWNDDAPRDQGSYGVTITSID